MNDRPRITYDEAKIRERYANEEGFFPSWMDEKPAGALTTLVDELVQDGLIAVPEDYRLSLLNDDEVDITGVIVQVEARFGWPLISDGWSDLDNYVPRDDNRGEDFSEIDALLEAIAGIIGRADRCISFAHNVRRAIGLVQAVAVGNTEYSELATRLLANRVLTR